MKVYPEDPRLSTYLLDELSPAEAEKLRTAIAGDPALQAALAELEIARTKVQHAAKLPASILLPVQREAILTAARLADQAAKTTPFIRSWKPYALAAAAAAIAFCFFFKRSPTAPQSAAIAPSAKAPAAPSATPPISPSSGGGVPTDARFRSTAEHPVLGLPIFPAKNGLTRITQAIRTERALPAPASVQLGEVLNTFPLKFNAAVAIARSPKANWHPDSREAGITIHTATLGAETIPCPWKPSAILLLISIRGNATSACQPNVSFHPDATTVSRYRLLGSPAGEDTEIPQNTTPLVAGGFTTHAIEIDAVGSAETLGSLSWSVDGVAAPGIPIKHLAASEPSDDARFAALICTFSQWLHREQTGIIDRDLIAALIRENRAVNLPAERQDFLALVHDALALP